MPAKRKIKAIVSDLDGVIRHYPKSRDAEIERRFQLPERSLASAAFEAHRLLPAITGLIRDEQWRQQIGEALLSRHPEIDCHGAVAEWSSFPGEVDFDFLSHLAHRATGRAFALLTNATSRLAADLRTLGIHGRFTHIFNTSELGVAKPDPAVFRQVVRALQLPAAEILFIDDSEKHVLAAKAEGLVAIHFRDRAQARADLASFLD